MNRERQFLEQVETTDLLLLVLTLTFLFCWDGASSNPIDKLSTFTQTSHFSSGGKKQNLLFPPTKTKQTLNRPS